MGLSDKTKKFIEESCGCSLAGKTVLITGANSGIGFKTAETMVYKGASVIMACRNRERAEKARDQLLADYPEADIRIMMLDLADLDSIDAFAEQLPDVDVFVNNAGLFHRPGQKTKQGFEMVIGTNYLGPYYLCEKVLPKLRECGHDVVLVNTISIVHKIARVDYGRFFQERGAYFRSKLCLARYTEHLAKECEGTNVHVYMNHPGLAITPIASHIFGGMYSLAKIVPINSAEKSSLSVAWLLSNAVPEGSVVGPDRLFGGWGYPEINRKSRRAQRDIEPLLEFSREEIAKKRDTGSAPGGDITDTDGGRSDSGGGKMKRILCYGDSNTYGCTSIFAEGGPGRLDREHRWPCLLQKELGAGYEIIEEGLNGRTTAYDEPGRPERNGATFLPACIDAHMPLDLVIITLGTNDAKRGFGLSSDDTAKGIRMLVGIVRERTAGREPEILIVSPVPMDEKALADPVNTDEDSLIKTREYAAKFGALAEETGCAFMDLSGIACTELADGIHLTEKAHAAAAEAYVAKIRAMGI